jgi:hypothetical protein
MGMYWRGQHKFKNVHFVPDAIITGFGVEYPGQHVYYVDDTAGSDSADGLSVQTPLYTIEAAIAKCTANAYDAIVVMQKSPSTHATGESWPIDLDKQGILLTGLYSRGLVSDSGFGPGTADENCVNIGANHVAVTNLYLQVHSGGTLGNVVSTDLAAGSGVYGFTLRNCWVGLQNTALYGFYTGDSVDWPYLLIEGCTFGVPNASNYTNAIRLFNASFGMIRNNIIYPASSYCISLLASCGNVGIFDNKITPSADTDGYGIYCTAGSSDNFIAGNMSGYGAGTATNHPFFDAGAANNNWGWNTEQEHETLPDAT